MNNTILTPLQHEATKKENIFTLLYSGIKKSIYTIFLPLIDILSASMWFSLITQFLIAYSLFRKAIKNLGAEIR